MNSGHNAYSDEELVCQLAMSKQQALVSLYNRYWDRLFVVAANLLGCAEEAEECVQNVFVGLWNRRKNLKLTHTLHTYLTVAIKYQALTVLGRRQRNRELGWSKGEDRDLVDNASPESAFITKELMQHLEESINRLPPQCQLIFRMRREDGKTLKTIAKELSVSENTVKMHLKNAHKKLRGDLLLNFFLLAYTPFL